MSLSFGTPVQFSNASGVNSNPVTTTGSLTISLNDTILVVCRGSISGLAATTISDTLGNTYQLRDGSGHGGGGQGICLYDCVGATHAGTSQITATSTGNTLVAIWAVNVSGLTSTPFQTATGAEIQGGGTAGTNNYTASSVTVSAAPAMVFCFLHDTNAEGATTGPPVAGTGWTGLGATWQAMGSGGSNAVALPVYAEFGSTGSQAAVFSLTAANKGDFFWNETAAYTEMASAPVATVAWWRA